MMNGNENGPPKTVKEWLDAIDEFNNMVDILDKHNKSYEKILNSETLGPMTREWMQKDKEKLKLNRNQIINNINIIEEEIFKEVDRKSGQKDK